MIETDRQFFDRVHFDLEKMAMVYYFALKISFSTRDERIKDGEEVSLCGKL